MNRDYFYDEEYDGPRYYYGCKRPIGVGNYPSAGLVIQTPPPVYAPYKPYGIILTYARPLSDQEIAAYELVPVDKDGKRIINLALNEETIDRILALLYERSCDTHLEESDQDEAYRLYGLVNQAKRKSRRTY